MKPPDLREEIALELDYVQQTATDATALPERVTGDEATVYDRAAAGMLLAQFYNGVENILKRFCKYHDVPLPSGPTSHALLFKRFCEPPQTPLPLLFPRAVEEDFVILRRFRHFVHHSYAFDLDWDRLRAGIARWSPPFAPSGPRWRRI